jgi:hypothetical protein
MSGSVVKATWPLYLIPQRTNFATARGNRKLSEARNLLDGTFGRRGGLTGHVNGGSCGVTECIVLVQSCPLK